MLVSKIILGQNNNSSPLDVNSVLQDENHASYQKPCPGVTWDFPLYAVDPLFNKETVFSP